MNRREVIDTATDKFTTPLYTVTEAAQYLGVPGSTFRSWAKGYVHRPQARPEVRGDAIVTVLEPRTPRSATVPFVGLAEGLVLTAIRRAGVPLQRIRPALDRLEQELGLKHALASRSLYTDGAEVLYDYANTSSNEAAAAQSARQLVVVRDGQRVFNEVVDRYLQRVEFSDDGYAALIRLPAYEMAEVVVDPRRGFGQPIFSAGGARVEDALGMFRAGESLAEVAAEFGVPASQLEDALRVTARAAA
jgi:uncharacterized protein (DUF433 family)